MSWHTDRRNGAGLEPPAAQAPDWTADPGIRRDMSEHAAEHRYAEMMRRMNTVNLSMGIVLSVLLMAPMWGHWRMLGVGLASLVAFSIPLNLVVDKVLMGRIGAVRAEAVRTALN